MTPRKYKYAKQYHRLLMSHARLAAGHPELNRGRMFLKHSAAVVISVNRVQV